MVKTNTPIEIKSIDHLCHLTFEGAKRRYPEPWSDEIKERIDFEIKTISYMGFSDYFLIIQDIVNWAKNNGILVGPGRGSVAGSVVSYCLRITNLDPLKHSLLFERFLNPGCISMPAIDLDLDKEGYYRVIQYVQDQYGTEAANKPTSFTYFPELNTSLLGQSTLSIISRALGLIKKRFGIEIDIEAIPIDDPAVFELFSRGDTEGVFMFESDIMRKWLMKLHPERFEDLIAMNALFRPGSMDHIPQLVARKTGAEPIAYDLPEMEEFLKETYGITIYQEQVMRISQAVAGFSKVKADELRKAMGKKEKDILDGLKKDFMDGAIANGHDAKIMEKVWADWEAFAKFSKSHATCYTWIGYQTAWLKAHYPAEFQTSNLAQLRSR